MTVDLAHLSPWLWIVAPVVIVAAYTVLGLSGFGSTVISVPILANFLPIAYLVPLMVLLDLVAAAAIGRSNRRQIATGELKRLVPIMFVGFVIGLTVLAGVPDRYLRIALGVFAAAVGVHGMLNPTLHHRISPWWCIPAGITGGAIATIFGAGGPIYATYLNGRLDDKGAIRATLGMLISVSAFSRAVLYAIGGLLLHASILLGALALAPFAWLGLRLGSRIHVGLSHAQMRRAIGAILVATGATLLARALL